VVGRARQAGYLDALESFGGQITVDCCPLSTPMLPPQIRAVMTDSGKHAYYAPGLLKTQTTLGSREACVESAIAGRVVRDSSLWGT
jgi:predicted aconitase